jgi:hypothetical protein
MTRAKRNARPLTVIADKINALARANIIEIGGLLNEAQHHQLEYGQWLEWLGAEFDWSEDTAERYMKVATLADRFRSLRNLKLAKTTLYALAKHDDEQDLSAAVAALTKHASQKRLLPDEAQRVINIAIGRRRYGDLPDATLVALVNLEDRRPWHADAVAALCKRRPETDDAADKIIEDIRWTSIESETDAAGNADDPEAVAILEGPPPVLPPPEEDDEPLQLDDDDGEGWPEEDAFRAAIVQLRALRAKPLARFIGLFPPNELREAIDLLVAIVAAEEKQMRTETVEPTP